MRDAIVAARAEWDDTLLRIVDRAIERGGLSAATDAPQLAFELRALLEAANADALRLGTAEPSRRARVAIDALLERARPA